MKQIKLKTYKLHRDSKKVIVQQIEWLKIHLNDDFDCNFIKSIYPLTKPELKITVILSVPWPFIIVIFEGAVQM